MSVKLRGDSIAVSLENLIGVVGLIDESVVTARWHVPDWGTGSLATVLTAGGAHKTPHTNPDSLMSLFRLVELVSEPSQNAVRVPFREFRAVKPDCNTEATEAVQ